MSINKQEYVAKITTASPLNLVIINFDIILDYIEESKLNLDNDKNFTFNIKKAREFLTELRCSLNMEYEISSYLLTMYNYVDRKIATFLFNKKSENIEEAIKILNNIKEGFENIEDMEENKKPIMENTETIYAGLTYGRDGKMQEYVDTKINRGFKA